MFSSVLFTVLLGCATMAFASGWVGAIVSIRGRNLEADVLAHSTLPGLVAGVMAVQFLSIQADWLGQLIVVASGLTAASVASVLLFGFTRRVSQRFGLQADSVQAVVLGLGFGGGLVLLSLVQSYMPAQRAGLDQLLLGNAAMITRADGLIGVTLCVVAVGLAWGLHRPMAHFLFDPVHWQAAGGRVWVAELIFSIALFFTVVFGMRIVGAVLTVALLTIPYLAARPWGGNSLVGTLWLSGLIAGLGASVGVWASTLALLPDGGGVPTGPSIVLALFALLLCSLGFGGLRKGLGRHHVAA